MLYPFVDIFCFVSPYSHRKSKLQMNTFAPDLMKSIKGQIFDKSVIDPLEVRQ